MECLCETWLDHLRITALRIIVITLKKPNFINYTRKIILHGHA